MTARDFTPTDGQAGAIESIMADIVPKALDVHPSSTGTRRLRERLVDHPAFQSIIAAAKAEAWDEGYRTCDQAWVETADLVTPDEERTDTSNPYRGEASA